MFIQKFLPIVAAASALALSGCGSTCSSSNCAGCCDVNDVCQSVSAATCGVQGAACTACLGAEICVQGACENPGGGNASGGSSATTASNTGSTTSAGSTSTTTSSGSSSTTGVATATTTSGTVGGTTGVSTTSPTTSGGTVGTSVSTSGTTGTGSTPVCSPCSANSDCASGICDPTSQRCQVDDCAILNSNECSATGFICNLDLSCSCNSGLRPLCYLCTADNQCQSGKCDLTRNTCTTTSCSGADATACADAHGTCGGSQCECSFNLCFHCSSDADCYSSLCDSSTHQCQTTSCTPGSTVETACSYATMSDFTGCAADGSCSCAPLGSVCESCQYDNECESGKCNKQTQRCDVTSCSGANATACTQANGVCAGSSCAC